MKWEYLAVRWPHVANDEAATFQAQALGNEGWELVGFHGDLAYFKRPVVLESIEEARPTEQQVKEITDQVLSKVVKKLKAASV